MNTEELTGNEGDVSHGGRASWEEPYLPFRQRFKKHWRQMLVHFWGPAGSLAFHIVAIGVLVTVATDTGREYVPGPVTELIPNAKEDKLEKEEIKTPDREIKSPDPDMPSAKPTASRSTRSCGNRPSRPLRWWSMGSTRTEGSTTS
jgi:hypothetical protein